MSLLIHDRLLYENIDPSNIIPAEYFITTDNFYTKLYWVGISLYYTNIKEEICSAKNAISLNIRVAEHSKFKLFNPFFAIEKKNMFLVQKNTKKPKYPSLVTIKDILLC